MSKKFLKMMNEMYDTFWIYFWVVIFFKIFFFCLENNTSMRFSRCHFPPGYEPLFFAFFTPTIRRREGERGTIFLCVKNACATREFPEKKT